MNDEREWWNSFRDAKKSPPLDGLVYVKGYKNHNRPPEEVAVIEKASSYGADAVFFEAGGLSGSSPAAQAFIFSDRFDDEKFALIHKKLWSWGGVPLVYRRLPGLVQLFRCAHDADFVKDGKLVCHPVRILQLASSIAAADPWWDLAQLRNGVLWQNKEACKLLLSNKSAHKRLIENVKELSEDLNSATVLPEHLRRKLLILSLLIAYLEEREVFEDAYLGRFLPDATKFFQVLADGEALVALLKALETRFNGNVFSLSAADREQLRGSEQLTHFARLVEGREDKRGQLTLWQLYSFKDLPVELISHIYQLFVKNSNTSIYTPPFLVRLMLEEALSWERLDRLEQEGEVILDPCCGSGVFLVESYKRVILHWRSRNGWKRPDEAVLKRLLNRVVGVDIEEGAAELAAFSLCLALCDALEPEDIRASIQLFPLLAGRTLHCCCFFQGKEQILKAHRIGVVVGNPPFQSSLTTPGAKRSYRNYTAQHGSMPDKQLAYLFLHESMKTLVEGGILCFLQQYNFLYNQKSLEFRRKFLSQWDVRELLDFISVRGLFSKGSADTKVLVIVAEALPPPKDRKVLHVTFRRSWRTDAEQGVDVDYYDLHWLPLDLVLTNDAVWRADLLGGGRVLAFIDRMKKFRTLLQYAEEQQWNYGEGFIEGKRGISRPASHLIGQPLLPSEALTGGRIDPRLITKVPDQPIEGPRSRARFTPPMLLVREQMNLYHATWMKEYLTYKNQMVGFAAPKKDRRLLAKIDRWMAAEALALQAFVAGVSVKLFTQKATTLSEADILAIPYPESGDLDLSANERIIAEDVVNYYRDLIRLGEASAAMSENGHAALTDFSRVFLDQINTVYTLNQLQPLEPRAWPGVICYPFVFGEDAVVDWSGDDALINRLDQLLRGEWGTTIRVTRIARIYDGSFIFLLKPDRLRYWLRSVALRDADEVLSDLRLQGF